MHYAGPKYGVKLRRGEHWKKVFGPVFMYLNSESSSNRTALWEDAKAKVNLFNIDSINVFNYNVH